MANIIKVYLLGLYIIFNIKFIFKRYKHWCNYFAGLFFFSIEHNSKRVTPKRNLSVELGRSHQHYRKPSGGTGATTINSQSFQ